MYHTQPDVRIDDWRKKTKNEKRKGKGAVKVHSSETLSKDYIFTKSSMYHPTWPFKPICNKSISMAWNLPNFEGGEKSS